MQILYGYGDKYVDVTYICYKKLLNNNTIKIPKNDIARASIFGDPIYGVLKNIKIDGIVYSDQEEVVLNVLIIEDEIKNFRRNWWNNTGKFLEPANERLARLHEHISLSYGNIRDEYPEQLMSMKFVKSGDTVLEIGGNIGRNSCIIASILDDDTRLVVLESCEEYSKQLEFNRDSNYFNFSIENSALSKVPLIQQGWNTKVSLNNQIEPGYRRVNTITFEQLLEKYQLNFNVLVLDCEGAIYQILKDEPDILNNIETIIIENDFTNILEKEFVHSLFLKNFNLVYNEAGGWGPCYNCFYQVYSKNS